MNIFVILALAMFAICAVLRFAPHLRLLNFVAYGSEADTAKLNRLASVWFLLPFLVNVACIFVAEVKPGLTVPMIFLTPLTIVTVVMVINASAARMGQR